MDLGVNGLAEQHTRTDGDRPFALHQVVGFRRGDGPVPFFDPATRKWRSFRRW